MLMASSSLAAETRTTLDGVWMPDSYSDRLLTADGQEPPLTVEAAELYRERAASLTEHDRQFDRTRWCAGAGMPRIMFMPYAFEIRSDRQFVGFLYSWYRWHRVADLSGKPADPLLPQTMGYPVARWDGDTLVIETVGLSDETVLDTAGLPHSEDMKLTERLRLLADGRLEARFTISDEAYYSRPWEAVMTYQRRADFTVGDDVCPDRIAMGEAAVRSALP